MTKKNLKIGILIDQLLPGGVQKAAIQEVKNLNKMGLSAKLLILMRQGFEEKNRFLLQNIPHEFISDLYPKPFQKGFKFPIFNFFSTLHLVSPILAPTKIKKNDYDLIVSHGTTTSLTTWSLSSFCKIPYIAVIHDPMVYILEKVYSNTLLRFYFPLLKPLATFLEKRFVKAARLCLVDSSVHAQFLKKSYSIQPKILYLGVNHPKSIPKKRGDYIISFGRWDRGKNLDILLQVLTKVKEAKLIVAGTWSNNSDLQWFKNQINEKGLKNRVKLITSYKEEELKKICAQGRVWAHPHFEAFSLSALEAASFGLPIIIPKKSGITELFVEGKHGFFPKETSVKTLSLLIKNFLDNPSLAYEMGLLAANLVKNHYSPTARSKQLKTFIEQILSKPLSLLALETGHVGDIGIAGGDLLLEEMAKHLKTPLQISVIVPQTNTVHWKKSPVFVKIIPLKKTFFDKYTGPWQVFATYLVRIIKSTLICLQFKRETILYSSTGIFPDVMPLFIIKLLRPKSFWVARIHHLSPPPAKRPGPYWVNLGSSVLQWLSLKTIKYKADKIIVLNVNLKNHLVKLGFSSHKIVIIGGGVNFQQIRNFKPSKTPQFEAVFLGRIHPAKGIFDIPQVAESVVQKNSEVRFAIIGPGPQDVQKILRAKIKKLGLEKNVEVLGFLPQEKVWSYLKNARVFLFTDHEAGFGLAVAEAMAAGLPVVGWDIGVLGQVYKSGYLKAPLENYEDFSKNILTLIRNDSLYSKLSSSAVKQASKYDWDITSRKFDQILSSITKIS